MSGREFSIYDIDRALGEMMKKFPEERRELVEDVGEEMYQRVLRNIDRDTKEHRGRLRKGVTKVIGSGGGYAAVRPMHIVAPHTHLVENGHAIKRNGTTIGWVMGRFMYRRALDNIEEEVEQKAKDMAERLVKECFD